MSFWAKLFGVVSKKEFNQFVNDQEKRIEGLQLGLELLERTHANHVLEISELHNDIDELVDEIDELEFHDVSDVSDRLVAIEKEVYGADWGLLTDHDGIALCGRDGIISSDTVIELTSNSRLTDVTGIKSKYDNLLYYVYVQSPNSKNRALFSPNLKAPIDISWCTSPGGVAIDPLLPDLRLPIPKNGAANIEVTLELEYWNHDEEHRIKKYIFLSTPDTVDSYFWNEEKVEALRIRLNDYLDGWCPGYPEEIIEDIELSAIEDFWIIDGVEYPDSEQLVFEYFGHNCLEDDSEDFFDED